MSIDIEDAFQSHHQVEKTTDKPLIRGKVDCVKRQSGKLFVFEHKKGKSNRGENAWPSDRLQVLAYTLLLADHTGEDINEARIRYHADTAFCKTPSLVVTAVLRSMSPLFPFFQFFLIKSDLIIQVL